eukprot:scaffold518_cov388-Prasinococcus_capsulatus_cf.AAC.34
MGATLLQAPQLHSHDKYSGHEGARAVSVRFLLDSGTARLCESWGIVRRRVKLHKPHVPILRLHVSTAGRHLVAPHKRISKAQQWVTYLLLKVVPVEAHRGCSCGRKQRAQQQKQGRRLEMESGSSHP